MQTASIACKATYNVQIQIPATARILSRSTMTNTNNYTGTAKYTSYACGTFSPHPAVGHLLLKEKDGRL
jgi:hypothetical protein